MTRDPASGAAPQPGAADFRSTADDGGTAVTDAPAAGGPRDDRGEALRAAAGLRAEGRLEEAARRYAAILAEAPAHHDALVGLGLIRLQSRQYHEAVALFRLAVTAQPTSVTALLWLGAALGDLDRRDEGLDCYRDALAIDPDSAAAHWVLGATLQKYGRLREAIPHFERAIAVKPDFATAHCALADALQDLGALNAAVVRYRAALAVQPGCFEAANNLGNAMRKLGRFEEAIAHYRHALALKPGCTGVCCNLAIALMGAARPEAAIAIIETVLRHEPSNAGAYKLLGFALEILGRADAAAAAFEKVLTLAPGDAEVHRHLAELRRFTAGDPRLAALEKLAGDIATLDTGNRISLHFTLGKAYGDLSRYERSFHHWRQGNALKRAQLDYDVEVHRGQFARTRAVFTSEFVQRHRGGGHPSAVPVFVVGMPRSGTTLVEQVLASHSKVHGAGETEAFHHVLGELTARSGIAGSFPDLVPAFVSAEALRALGAAYVAALASLAPHAERVVNKLPGNFLYVALVHLALPDARIIHVRRDPLDTCFSCFSLPFSLDHQPFTYDLSDLGRYYRAYAALMDHWRRVLPHGAVLEVHYEDLVADLQGQARAIVDYCGLAWEDACLSFYENRRPVRTASLLQVRKPIYRTSVGRWRPYERFLGPLIAALNEPDGGDPAVAAPAG